MVGTEVIYLDTNVLVWLRLGNVEKLGREGRKAIERHEVRVSAAAVLELGMLHEIGRLRPTASQVVSDLAKNIGLHVCQLPFSTIVDYALAEGWTCDPFDRLIVGNAKAADAALITKDERILEHYSRALW